MKNEQEAKPATNAMYYEEEEYKLEDELDCDKGYVDCCREGGDNYSDDDDKGENDSDVDGSHGNDGDDKLVHKGSCDKEQFLKQMKNKLCKDDDKNDEEDHNQEKSKIDVIDLCSSDDNA